MMIVETATRIYIIFIFGYVRNKKSSIWPKILFLGAKAPLELAHVKKKNNGTKIFGTA